MIIVNIIKTKFVLFYSLQVYIHLRKCVSMWKSNKIYPNLCSEVEGKDNWSTLQLMMLYIRVTRLSGACFFFFWSVCVTERVEFCVSLKRWCCVIEAYWRSAVRSRGAELSAKTCVVAGEPPRVLCALPPIDMGTISYNTTNYYHSHCIRHTPKRAFPPEDFVGRKTLIDHLLPEFWG